MPVRWTDWHQRCNFPITSFRTSRIMQILVAALIAVLVFLQYLLWIAEDGVRQTFALRVSVQAQTEENAALNERNRAIEADIKDLKTGLVAIEERARSEMGMIRQDETFYRLLERPLPQEAPSAKPQPARSSTPILASPSIAKKPPEPSSKPAPAARPAPTVKSVPEAKPAPAIKPVSPAALRTAGPPDRHE